MTEPGAAVATVQGPAEVMKGTPRQAATPPSATRSSFAASSKSFFLSAREGAGRSGVEREGGEGCREAVTRGSRGSLAGL